MFRSFMANNAWPIGVDLGAVGVRLIQLQAANGRVSVGAAAHEKMPPALRESKDAHAVGAFLRQVLASNGFSGKACVSVVPDSLLQYKIIRLPKMPPADLQSAVLWEAAERLSVDAATHEVRYFDAGEVMQGEEMRQELIVMAAARADVDHHLRTLTAAGLHTLALDVSPAALARWIVGRRPVSIDEQPTVVLDTGFALTKVMLINRGRVQFYRPVEVGGRQLVEAVAKSLGVSPEQAEELRRDEQSPRADAVQAAQRGVMDQIVREVGLCLRYHGVTFRGARPNRLLMVGSDPVRAWLGREAAAALDLELIDHPSTPGVQDQSLGEQAHVWACAMGLALRRPTPARGRKAAA